MMIIIMIRMMMIVMMMIMITMMVIWMMLLQTRQLCAKDESLNIPIGRAKQRRRGS